ncbi:hypothetical protein HPC49_01410 [Pyxidicoccus fallax]|uniref:Uncharacterized protein n=1 Tax=Pyxidicoccus fallax TaxID=394095 RepID=A0A848LAC9_9BACT|nr:hypothetical protein [Pyxidicoccus fallax]NMO15212.1 hypothetical protein [Pyxidicoccus fallax]NPC76911.1 hypothetical protein [Pyxidicoccus fallax]
MATAFLTLAGCQGEPSADGSEASLGTQASKAESECIEQFKGIKSCALGAAKLDRTEEGLQVTELKDSKTDGLSSQFEGAVQWSQDAFVEDFGSFTLAARDGDQVISTLQVTNMSMAGRSASAAGAQFGLTVNFDSPMAGYWINAYSEMGLEFSIQSSTYVPLYIRWNWPGHGLYWHPTFRQVRTAARAAGPENVGACVWGLSAGKNGPFTLVVDGKEVVATSIEIIENLDKGAYPYNTFSGIDVTGSATRYTVARESVIRE